MPRSQHPGGIDRARFLRSRRMVRLGSLRLCADAAALVARRPVVAAAVCTAVYRRDGGRDGSAHLAEAGRVLLAVDPGAHRNAVGGLLPLDGVYRWRERSWQRGAPASLWVKPGR